MMVFTRGASYGTTCTGILRPTEKLRAPARLSAEDGHVESSLQKAADIVVQALLRTGDFIGVRRVIDARNGRPPPPFQRSRLDVGYRWQRLRGGVNAVYFEIVTSPREGTPFLVQRRLHS